MQRTVVVTGCSSGLGESVAHALLNSYDVLGVDINDPHTSLVGNEGFEFLQLDLSQDTLCLLYTSPSPRDRQKSRMPSSA